MTDQIALKDARERFNSFHKFLFTSDLVVVHLTMQDCEPDLPATWDEKARVAKAMSLADLEKDLTHTKRKWFSRKKVARLLREKDALLQL